MRYGNHVALWEVLLLWVTAIFPTLAQQRKELERIDSLLSYGVLTEAENLIGQLTIERGGKRSDPLMLRAIKLSFLQGNPFQALEQSTLLSNRYHKMEEGKVLQIALLYHSYHFEEILSLLEKGEKWCREKGGESFQVRLEEKALRAKQLIESTQLIEVVDSIAITNLDDLRHASGLSHQIGRLSFGKELDDYCYTTALGFETLTHCKGEDGKNHILYCRKTTTGEVLEERELEELHLPGGEYFPVLRQDGQSVLFASPTTPIDLSFSEKESGDFSAGIGGFDLYISRRDLSTGWFQIPTLLGMPFNSPKDDLLLLYDDLYQVGLLVTTRFARMGLFNCYRFVIPERAIPSSTNDYELKKKYAALYPWKITTAPSSR